MMIQPKGKQFEIIDLPLKGHNVVLGAAGSGKTTCALIRANMISEVKNESVLLLTYNNSLVNYMNNIDEKNENVEITTYHKFLSAYLRKNGLLKYNGILGEQKMKDTFIKKAIKEIIKEYGENTILMRESFIIEEISWMQKVGCLTLEEYKQIVRYGRGKGRFDRVNRKYVFYVYERYIQIRSQNGYQYDWDDIAYYANKYIVNNNITSEKKYNHIIIDEGQDFSTTMIQFLVNYIKDDGSIMYLGDAAQQIFGSNGTWISSGLNIKKAYKLDENYRNTIEIEALGNEIRKNIELSDQEVKFSQNSTKHGELPVVIKAESSEKEIEYILNKAKELKKTGSVGIICPTLESRKKIENYFSLKNASYLLIDRNQTKFNGQSVICIGTYHSLKGLEFDNVILYDCTDKNFDFNDSEEGEQSDEISNKIAKLLYVGVTRARRNLLITYTDKIMKVFPTDKNLYKIIYV